MIWKIRKKKLAFFETPIRVKTCENLWANRTLDQRSKLVESWHWSLMRITVHELELGPKINEGGGREGKGGDMERPH